MKVLTLILIIAILLIVSLNSLFQTVIPIGDLTLSSWKDLIKVLESIFTIVAIVVGGLWGYWLFVKNRQRYPRASLTHKVIHKEIEDGKNLLHVDIVIYNIGEVLLQIKDVNTIVSQVLPLCKKISNLIENGKDPVKEGASDIEWPEIGSRAIKYREDPCEVEPGETQSLQCDFLLDASILSVEIYSYVENLVKRGRELVWDHTSIYDLSSEE